MCILMLERKELKTSVIQRTTIGIWIAMYAVNGHISNKPLKNLQLKHFCFPYHWFELYSKNLQMQIFAVDICILSN